LYIAIGLYHSSQEYPLYTLQDVGIVLSSAGDFQLYKKIKVYDIIKD
jgi:hypothetical protein